MAQAFWIPHFESIDYCHKGGYDKLIHERTSRFIQSISLAKTALFIPKRRFTMMFKILATLFCAFLWIAGPAFAATYSYYLPYFYESATSNAASGLALRNCSVAGRVNLSVSVYSQTGTKLKFATNAKIPATLPTRGQNAFLVDTSLSTAKGWVRVDSDQPLVGLCFISVDGFMMDVPIFSELQKLLYVPHCAQNDTWDTSVFIANPNSTQTSVTITVVNDVGSDAIKMFYTIPANGSREYKLDDLLPSDLRNGSVEISASQGVAAFALYQNLKTTSGSSFAGISAIKPPSASDDDDDDDDDDSSFDGTWTGSATATTSTDYYGDPCSGATLSFTVTGGEINGTARDSYGETYNIEGTIDDAGNIYAGIFVGDETGGTFSGKASGNKATGTWSEVYGCRGTWSLSKR
jgi:hypothetical protein